MATPLNSRDKQRYEQGKELVLSVINEAVAGVDNPQQARLKAQEVMQAFIENKGIELEQAARRFKLYQRIEFVVGALVLVQMGIFLLYGEPYIVPLIFSATASAIVYVIVAIIDSKAKGARQDIHFEIQAARKAKFRNNPEGKGILVDFK